MFDKDNPGLTEDQAVFSMGRMLPPEDFREALIEIGVEPEVAAYLSGVRS